MSHTASPFRYPGGKTQLYKFVSNILSLNKISGTYIEPFAGGAGIAIALLLNNEVERVVINDFDKSIYSVWFNILNRPEELINMIDQVPFDYYDHSLVNSEEQIDFWKKQKSIYLQEKSHQNSLTGAFATLFLNRTNRSGIIAANPIGGLKQNGKNTNKIYVRFNKKTLIKKISEQKNRIDLYRTDASKLITSISQNYSPKNTFIFFDPPYFKQGQHLYYSAYNEKGHKELSDKIQSLKKYNWITTYDTADKIAEFYQNTEQKFTYNLRYSANNKNKLIKSEFLFASQNLKIESFNNINLLPI